MSDATSLRRTQATIIEFVRAAEVVDLFAAHRLLRATEEVLAETRAGNPTEYLAALATGTNHLKAIRAFIAFRTVVAEIEAAEHPAVRA